MWCGICDLLECGDEDGVGNFIGEREVGNILCSMLYCACLALLNN